MPLASAADRRAFVAAAAAVGGAVLTNNRYSGDILAIPAGVDLSDLPDLDGGQRPPALAGRPRASRSATCAPGGGSRWTSIPRSTSSSPGCAEPDDPAFDRVRDAGDAASRSSAADPSGAAARRRADARRPRSRWLEAHTASRTRALVEERGMRTAAPGQRPGRDRPWASSSTATGPRPSGGSSPSSPTPPILDTRVLLAHRLGADEAAWPAAEDRFASDLLLHERIADPWLRALTRAAATAPIPVLLGGHTLVGPGLRLLLRGGVRDRRS